MSDSTASKPERIVVRCTCGKKVGAPFRAAGKAVKCPKCGQRVAVPADGMKARPPSLPPAGRTSAKKSSASKASSDRIKVECSCGKHIRVPASGAGKKGKCPACGEIFKVPALNEEAPRPSLLDDVDLPQPSLLEDEPRPKARAQAAPEPESVADDAGGEDLGGGLFAELGDGVEESSGGGVVNVMACPHCHAMIAAGSARCPMCEKNPAKPPKVKKQRQRSGVGGGGLMGAVSGTGSALTTLALGSFLACIGATIGGAIWVGVAIVTGFELSYIAWLLGGMTGFGMVLGTRSESVAAGIVAAFISAGAIVVAKFAIVILVLFPAVAKFHQQATGMAPPGVVIIDEVKENRQDLREIMLEEEFEARGIRLKSRQYYAVYNEVSDQVNSELDAMTPEEIEAELYARDAEAEADYRNDRLVGYLVEEDMEALGLDFESEGYEEAYTASREKRIAEVESWDEEKVVAEYEKRLAIEEARWEHEAMVDTVASHRAKQDVKKLDIARDVPAYRRHMGEAYDKHVAEIEGWSDEQLQTEYDRIVEQQESKVYSDADSIVVDDGPTSEWVMFLGLLFGMHGLAFTLVAMGTAFWVGYGGFERA